MPEVEEQVMKARPKKMPAQKPGKSEQVVATPQNLLDAVKDRLKIVDFSLDVAADDVNHVCGRYLTEAEDGLIQDWILSGWNWCNPPFGQLEQWTSKAAHESMKGASTAMLVPASVGSNWWLTWVEGYAYQSFLNGRITFVGHDKPYPKDCAILLYTPWGFCGHEIWNWKR